MMKFRWPSAGAGVLVAALLLSACAQDAGDEADASTDDAAVEDEVEDEAEEQSLPSAGTLDLHWLHRNGSPAGAGRLRAEALAAIEASTDSTYVWAACEKDDIRAIRALLRRRGHDTKRMYVAWYWERQRPAA